MREDTIIAVLGWELAKEWTAYAEFKFMYYTSLTNFFLGLEAEEAGGPRMGEAVAYYAKASRDLIETGKSAKHFSSACRDEQNIDFCLAFTGK